MRDAALVNERIYRALVALVLANPLVSKENVDLREVHSLWVHRTQGLDDAPPRDAHGEGAVFLDALGSECVQKSEGRLGGHVLWRNSMGHANVENVATSLVMQPTA